MTDDSYDKGMAVRRKMLGDAWVDRTLQNRNEFNTEFQEMITRHVWGDIWTRPGIDTRTRRFMVLSIMIALASWDEFRLHVRSGLAECAPRIPHAKEMILRASAYCRASAGNLAKH